MRSFISERIKIEENYKLLFYSNPLPMWTYDLQTLRFLDVNDAAIQHYGYSREEFLSMTLTEIRPPEEIHQLMKIIDERNNEGLFHSTVKHKKKNGKVISVEITTNTVEKEGRKTVLVASKDITEKIKAENDLLKSNERFSYAAKALSEVLWEWDVVTDQVFISEVYTDLLGWELNKRIKFCEWHDDYVHPDEKKNIIEGYYRTLADPNIGY